MTPGPTKGKQTIPLPPGFQLSHAGLTVLPLFSRLSRKLHYPKTICAFLHAKYFPQTRPSRNICPNPQRISKVKQARPRRLSRQQGKYRESMASSTIFDIHNPIGKISSCPGRECSNNRLRDSTVLGLWGMILEGGVSQLWFGAG